jgi:hypothetical protein
MKVKVIYRQVYHKIAEVEIEIPNDVDEFDVQDYINDHEELWVKDIDEYGFGLGDGMDEKKQDEEWRYHIVDKNFGGHL